MNASRRSFLRLLGAAGAAAVTAPSLALADRIRVLPDAAGTTSPPLPGQSSPELGRTLGGLIVGPAATQGGLAVLWLQTRDSAGGPPLEILTLDESRARGVLTVIERAQASVPELIAENRGKAYVLLLAGEILIGGKQNRVLREDLLLPPHSGPRNIGVYCVEQGRWNEGRKDFDSLGSVVQPSVRSQVLRKAEQGRIWSGIASASRNLAAPSATGSYQAIYDKPEVKAHLEQTTRRFEPAAIPAAVGAAVFVGPNLAGVDCFHAPGLFAREWPKLLRAYALDAYGVTPAVWDEAAARSRADGLLRAAARVEGRARGSVGAGRLFEFTLDARRGAALLFEGQAIHVAIL
jgi:ARG/rhodanese/phosphatase superfamily protein